MDAIRANTSTPMNSIAKPTVEEAENVNKTNEAEIQDRPANGTRGVNKDTLEISDEGLKMAKNMQQKTDDVAKNLTSLSEVEVEETEDESDDITNLTETEIKELVANGKISKVQMEKELLRRGITI